MTDAIQGNSMIPTSPGIAAQQIAAGAQQISAPSSGAPPIVPDQQIAPVKKPEEYDFWASVEKRIDPAPSPQDAAPTPVQPVVPTSGVTPAPPPTVPVATALTPEQQAAIVEAGAQQAPVAQPPQQLPPAQGIDFVQQTIDHLAKTEYAMPKDVADKLVTAPEEVYPRLAATMHVRLATQIGQAVQNLLPAVIDKIVTQKMEAIRLEGDFFRTYPQLADARFRPVVAQSLSMARAASPQGTREQIMNDGAALAALKLRLLPTNGAQAPVQPVVPQQVLQPALVPVQPQVAPFQPAAGGGGALPIVQQQEQNEFELLAMDPNW